MDTTLNIPEPQIGNYIAQPSVYQHLENCTVFNMGNNCTHSDEEGGLKGFLEKIKMIITFVNLIKIIYEFCSFLLGWLG